MCRYCFNWASDLPSATIASATAARASGPGQREATRLILFEVAADGEEELADDGGRGWTGQVGWAAAATKVVLEGKTYADTARCTVRAAHRG